MNLIDKDALKKDILALPNCYNGFSDTFDKACIIGVIDEQPTIEERKWIPCSEPPENEKNVFIAHGTKGFMTCCIGHYDRDSGLWYEDRNWFARPIFDGAFWCEMPPMPEAEG